MCRPREELSPYSRASIAIKSTNLSALEHSLLTTFMLKSVSMDQTSQFILDRISAAGGDVSASQLEDLLQPFSSPSSSTHEAVRAVKEDLMALAGKFSSNEPPVNAETDAALRERDANRCVVTGRDDGDDLKPTYIVSPSIKDDPDLQQGSLPHQGRLRELLEVAIGKDLTSRLFDYLDRSSRDAGEERLKNMWLMAPDVRERFVNGHITMGSTESAPRQWWIAMQFPQDSNIPDLHSDFYTQPTTPDQQRLPLPENFLLQIHQIVSLPLHFSRIEKKISRGWPQVEKQKNGLSLGLERFGRFLVRGIFYLVPNSLHPALYRLLLKAVDYWDPQPNTGWFTRTKSLPLDLCLKVGKEVSKNEATALHLVEKYTTINAPRLINFTRGSGTGEKGEGEGENYLLTTRPPGVPLHTVFWRMTYEERRQLGRDLAPYIRQLRQIPIPNKHSSNKSPIPTICDTTGGPLTDYRLDRAEAPWGPYTSTTAFLDQLTADAGLEARRTQPPLAQLYKIEHEIYFTHSALSLQNILVKGEGEGGRLCGIVNFEHAGFKPEFWEFTRAVWKNMSDRRLAEAYSLAYEKGYWGELEAERLLWERKPVL
ncbi:hypothetical protein FQN52_007887 [Onygenales sp. PD_12]|nr:hypothetical protein FQN52_007887 [Onygenales sp. PD_12]